MFYNQQPQQQLPFNPEGPQFQPRHYQFNEPPFVPNNIQIPHELTYMLPGICASVANELTTNMGKHQGRMFTYNQLGANGFRNDEFASTVAAVFDMLMLNLRKGIIGTPEQGAQEAVSTIVAIVTCNNIAKFPGLANMVDPRLIMEAQNTLNQAANLQNEINNMKRGNSSFGNQNWNNQNSFNNQSNQQFGWGGNQNNQGNQNWSTFNQQPQQHPNGNNRQGWATFNSNNSGHVDNGYGRHNMPDNRFSNNNQNNEPKGNIFRQNNSQPQQQDNQFSNNSLSNKYDHLKKPFNSQIDQVSVSEQTPSNQFNLNKNTEPPKEFTRPCPPPAEQKQLVWKGSKYQFHPPAYNFNTEKLVLTEEVYDGKTYVIAKVVKLGVHEVNRETHTITTARQAIRSYIPEGFSTREEAFKEAVKQMPNAESDVLKSDIITDKSPFISNFDESIEFDVMARKKLLPKTNNSSVFQLFCIRAKPFFATRNIRDIAQRLSKMNKLSEVASALRNILNGDAAIELKTFVSELDVFLTEEINYFLQNKMNVGVSLDSFVDDVSDLAGYLGSERGTSFSSAFIGYERKFIETFITPIVGDELIADITDSLLGDEDKTNKDNSFVLYNHNLSYTLVDMDSGDIGVGIQAKGSSVVEYDSFPVLYEFCSKLFDKADKVSSNFVRHILITSDGKRFDIHRSVFSKDTILINRIK